MLLLLVLVVVRSCPALGRRMVILTRSSLPTQFHSRVRIQIILKRSGRSRPLESLSILLGATGLGGILYGAVLSRDDRVVSKRR